MLESDCKPGLYRDILMITLDVANVTISYYKCYFLYVVDTSILCCSGVISGRLQ